MEKIDITRQIEMGESTSRASVKGILKEMLHKRKNWWAKKASDTPGKLSKNWLNKIRVDDGAW